MAGAGRLNRIANSLAYGLQVAGSEATALWAAASGDVNDGDAGEAVAFKQAAQADKRLEVVLSSRVNCFVGFCCVHDAGLPEG